MKKISEVLTVNRTIVNNSAAKITSDKVGVDTFAEWSFAIKCAYESLYKFTEAQHTHALDNSKVIDKNIIDHAYNAIQMLLDCIGEVNGHKLVKNESMLNELCKAVYQDKKVLIGDTLLQKSIVDNLRKELNAIPNGADEKYTLEVTKKYETAKIKLDELKKTEQSCATYRQRTSLNSFVTKLEKTLSMYVTKQAMKTWEELETEEKERKEQAKERAKARRQAKRQAAALNK